MGSDVDIIDKEIIKQIKELHYFETKLVSGNL